MITMPWRRKTRADMTVADIEEEVEKIRNMLTDPEPTAYDNERASLAEYTLWENVLDMIANTKGITGFEATQLARAALKTQEVQYDRWLG